jgi:hypothetical protein
MGHFFKTGLHSHNPPKDYYNHYTKYHSTYLIPKNLHSLKQPINVQRLPFKSWNNTSKQLRLHKHEQHRYPRRRACRRTLWSSG